MKFYDMFKLLLNEIINGIKIETCAYPNQANLNEKGLSFHTEKLQQSMNRIPNYCISRTKVTFENIKYISLIY